MKKRTKSTVSLSAAADTANCGLILALRKGANELLRRENRKSAASVSKTVRSGKALLSVIICTANRGTLAFETANSILKQDFDPKKREIIIVNNSDTPLPKDSLPHGVICIDEPTPGLSRARNSGARAAKGEYLLYMDDDAVACDGLAHAMYNAFENHPKCAIIGGQIFLKTPTPTPEIFLEGKEALWSAYTVPYTTFREIREQYEFPYGACFGIRRSALLALGGFPESYGRTGDNFAGGEETALCFAALGNGMKIGIEPSAAAEHRVSPDRFTAEHVRHTIREGIITTHRLFRDGYTSCGWTAAYIRERIKITEAELNRLEKHGKTLAAFYKKCELDAFYELNNTVNESDDIRLS